MIVYNKYKVDFVSDVFENNIEGIVEQGLLEKAGKRVSPNEKTSFKNSLRYMYDIVNYPGLPNDSRIAIEYNIPRTSNRIDFMISGLNEEKEKSVVIVELKQWSSVEMTEKDAIVKTFLGGAVRETTHPSYQAWSYAALLEDFNESVETEDIQLKPCAYLHNCENDTDVRSPFYKVHLEKAPVFIKSEPARLREFIANHIKHGDKEDLLYIIDNGRVRPSKNLSDTLVSLIQGNPEFTLVDDQKLVYETVLNSAKKLSIDKKQVIVVEGGPGTGKTVLAINLLVELTHRGNVVQYVTKNAAPRAVYLHKLTGTLTRTRINNMFTGSGSFTETSPNLFDVLVVDEAHRLNEKSGMFSNLGENQIKEIINASKCSVFFIDEDQRVTFKDIGSKAEIQKWSEEMDAEVIHLDLKSQFRCGGSDGFLAWMDMALGIRETANYKIDTKSYDFRVFDSPVDLKRAIVEKNSGSSKARIVAGYCWKWVSQKDSNAFDFHFEEYGFSAKWNLKTDGSLWITSPHTINEIGCIHTCQGLEIDYIGVILGRDFLIRDGQVVTNALERASTDQSIKGYKTMLKADKESAMAKADLIIKNTYRTLMTRGMKGCYVFSVDKETNEYFKKHSIQLKETT